MSLVNIPVMGSAQDLRRQLRYSAKPSASGTSHYYNRNLNDHSSTTALKSERTQATSLVTPRLPATKVGTATTTNINPITSFPLSNKKYINSNPSSFNMSRSSRTSARVQAPSSNLGEFRHSRQPSSYMPPPPRSYHNGESDRASQYSNRGGTQYSVRNGNTVSARKPTSVARSTASSHRQPAPSTHTSRPRHRPLSPYHQLTLPDEPEITRNFPNSDPNAVAETILPVPSGYVGYTGSQARHSRNIPSGTVGKLTTSTSQRPNTASVSRQPRRSTSAVPSGSVVSRNIAPQDGSHPYQRPPSRAPSRAPSRLPFIPPNGVHPVSAGPKPLARSPPRSRAPSPTALHVENSPSAVTVDSNAGPRVREGHPLSGLTGRSVSPEPEAVRNRSQSRMPRQSVNRGRSLQRSEYTTQDAHPNQVQNYSSSRPRPPSHSVSRQPPPSVAASAAIPTPAPIPVPTPIAYPQRLATSIPGEGGSHKDVPFSKVNKRRFRQLIGNYVPHHKNFRPNKIGAQVDGPSQDNYLTRPVHLRRSHIHDDVPNRSTSVRNHYPNDRSSPAVITRRLSHHSNLDAIPNQRDRSASRHSRHSRHSRNSQSRQSRHSSRNSRVSQTMRDRNTRAPVHAVQIEEDHTATNRTSRNRPLKWKWPTTKFDVGKLFNLNSGLRPRRNARVATDIPGVGTVEVVQDSHKRVRADSNLSMNWNLPQMKNFKVFKARIRNTPAAHSSLLPRPVIHPLLRTATIFRPARLHWDVRNQSLPPMSGVDTAAMIKLLKEPATSPPTTHMRILLRSPVPQRSRMQNSHQNPKYWEVEVTPTSRPSQNHPQPYIKCMDVIRAFGKMLRTTAETSEFDSLDDMHQRLAIRVFEMRAAGIFGPQNLDSTDPERVKAREMRKGYRKVDLLVNQTRWDGLQPTKGNSNDWIVKLGRVPLNPF